MFMSIGKRMVTYIGEVSRSGGWRRALLGLMVVGAVLAACGTTETPTPSPTVSPISPVGTPEVEASPSPTGMIVFHSNRAGSGGYHIYTMWGDGSFVEQVTTFAPPNSEPTWSPDGSRIAFTTGKDDISNFTLYAIDADGSNPERLLEPVKGDNWYPAWSPDGTRIAFQSNRDGNMEIYMLELETKAVTRLTNNDYTDSMPSWSPDSRQLVYVSSPEGEGDIHVMNADGSDVVRLTFSEGPDTQPKWSPDGKKILFMSGRDGNGEIYMMNADGSEQTRITDTPYDSEWTPSWAMNGTKILFSAPYDSDWEIYLMDPDGSNRVRLTEEMGDDRHATWLDLN